jgi:hypothetical protein
VRLIRFSLHSSMYKDHGHGHFRNQPHDRRHVRRLCRSSVLLPHGTSPHHPQRIAKLSARELDDIGLCIGDIDMIATRTGR